MKIFLKGFFFGLVIAVVRFLLGSKGFDSPTEAIFSIGMQILVVGTFGGLVFLAIDKFKK